jgi:hypothetical protein
MANTLGTSLDVSLVSGKAEGCRRDLDHKEVKVSIGRQSLHLNVHHFDWTDRFDFYPAMRVGKNGGIECRIAHHVESKFVFIPIAGQS